MRGREFIMKDAYSFHADEASLRETYAAMDGAYRRIFARCGLRAVAVEADSGAIGGSASQEFMVTAAAGEDLILASGDGRYAANQERAVSQAPEPVALPDGVRASGQGAPLSTPKQTSIEALCEAHGFHATQTVKVLLMLARFEDGSQQPLLISLRGDQQLNEVKLANAVTARCSAEHGSLLDVGPLSAEAASKEGLSPIPFGFMGPHLGDTVLEGARSWAPTFLRLADPTATELEAFICGANTVDTHLVGAAWGGLCPAPESLDLRAAQPGDRCQHDPNQQLEASRGIEVGHIFQLGRKYSEALEARFTNETGVEEALWMGCYGIGVSRLAQAAVEQHHDDHGMCWPVSIAPFEVIVVVANGAESEQLSLGERTYNQLQEAGVDVLLDDRAERAGVKFKDADLIGIPWRVVVGRGAAAGLVELVERSTGHKQELPANDLLGALLPSLQTQRRGLEI
jgi:prolyl-tRNA synthetase